MELRDFAEQVLFATILDEKLQAPADVTDDRPGSPMLAPQAPGRPAELRFKPPGSGKADFPGVHRLEQEHERGRLLHFFANHELLATELMALALLRFPNAPGAFRRGVWQTLKDEQLHTRLYVQRMRQCGIQFGELPVSGYTGLINNAKGQFQANWAAANYDRHIPANVAALFGELADISGCLQRLYRYILSLLEAELQHAGFVGPVGIDAFVYRTSQGGCRLKPVVEINPRYTMGRLTLELMKQTCPGSCGLFRLVSLGQAREEGFADFATYASSLSERFPLRLEGEPVPRIGEGILCLNDPAQAQVCLATFQVSRTLNPLLDRAERDDLLL